MNFDPFALIDSAIQETEKSIASIDRDIQQRTNELASELLLGVFSAMEKVKSQSHANISDHRQMIPFLVDMRAQQQSRLEALKRFRDYMGQTDVMNQIAKIDETIQKLLQGNP